VTRVEGWEGYYAALEGRPPRPLLLEALALVPPPDASLPPLAVDLGCGDGTETRELIARGWSVLAVDKAPEAIGRVRASLSAEEATRLTAIVASFGDVDLPRAGLIYAGLSLPFCDADELRTLWPRIAAALGPDGWFAGHFFGPRDSWAGSAEMTFLSRDELETLLLADFRIEVLREQDEDGDSFSGPKHWHVFHVVAQRGA